MSCSDEDILPALNSRNSFLLLSQCGFLVATHWKQLACHLRVSLDDRNKLEMLAMLSRDFSHALEESLDIWIRNNPSATWEDLIKSVELLELATADRLRHAVHTKQLCLSPHHNARQVEMAASIIQQHLSQLCEIIKDPVPIACHLFERKVIDDTYYQAAICPRSLQFKDMSVRTIQLVNAIYQTAVNRCRVDVISIFINVLEEMELVKPLAVLMRAEFDQVMLISTTNVSTGDMAMSPLHRNNRSISESVSSQGDEFVDIDVVLTMNAEQKFDRLRMRFGSIIKKLCVNLTSKPVPLRDLKDQLIFSFPHLEECVEPCSSIAEVMKVLLKSNYCSFANCLIVECLLQEFELQNIENDLTCYCRERDRCYETIMMEDFVQEAQECIERNSKVVFCLDLKKYKTSLAEFEQMLRAVFQGAAKYITLKQINDGSIIAICECPDFIVGCLKIIINEKEKLLFSYKVTEITIDGVVVMKNEPNGLYHHNSDNTIERCATTAITRLRSRTSSDMRDIELLPELSPSPTAMQDSPPPIPPRTHPDQSRHLHRVPFQYSYSIPPPATEPLPPRAVRSMSNAGSRPPYPLPIRSQSYSSTQPYSNTQLYSNTQPPGIIIPDISYSSDLSLPPVENSLSLSKVDSGIAQDNPSVFIEDRINWPLNQNSAPDEDDKNKQHCWYWDILSREQINNELSNTPDGTFVVRKNQSPFPCKYSIIFRHNGNTKNIGIVFDNNKKYHIRGCHITFDSLPLLVDHYINSPLPHFNGKEVTILDYHDTEGVDGDVIGIKQLIAKLQEVSNTFDDKSANYQTNLALKFEARKNLTDLNSAITGNKNASDLLRESIKTLEQNYNVEKMNTLSLNRMSYCYKTLQSKIETVEKELSADLVTEYAIRSNYQSLQRVCNSLRTDLTSLSDERDVIMRKLINNGFSMDEIYGMVKMKAFNEVENTYVTFYKTEMNNEETFSNAYEYIVLGSTRHRGLVQHPRHDYEYPRWSVLPRMQSKEPFYDTVDPDTKPAIVRKTLNEDSGFSLSSPDLSRSPERRLQPVLEREKEDVHKITFWKPASWYFDHADGKTAEKMLTNCPDGTFLCRPAGREPLMEGGIHVYTVHVVNKKKVADLKVIRQNGMFGFSVPCIFNSLFDLIVHHSNASLQAYDPKLCVTLEHPVHIHKAR